jgi:hypothetical protein
MYICIAVTHPINVNMLRYQDTKMLKLILIYQTNVLYQSISIMVSDNMANYGTNSDSDRTVSRDRSRTQTRFQSKCCLGVVQPHDDTMHGKYDPDMFYDNNDHLMVCDGFILSSEIYLTEFDQVDEYDRWLEYIQANYRRLSNHFAKSVMRHSTDRSSSHTDRHATMMIKYLGARNHIDIVERRMVKMRVAPGDENRCEPEEVSTAIIKTHYLRLVQRKWRRLYRERISKRCCPANIQYRHLHGQWPSNCRHIL